MAEINFGILDTQSPAKIGNAFTRTPEQQNANMLQAMQMKHLIDQSDQAQYAISKARREDTGMTEFGNAIKALGPDPDPLAIAQVFMKHPNPDYQLKGFELQRQAQADQRYRDLGPMGGPAARPATAPASPFTANMMANRAALPTFGDNQLAATVAAPAAPAAPMTEEGRIAEIQPRLALLRPLKNSSTDAKAEYDTLMAELIELRKPETIAAGSTRRKPGYATFTAPSAKSEFETLLDNSGLSESEKTAARQARVGKESTTSYEYLTTLDRLGKTTDPTERDLLKGRLTQLATHALPTQLKVNTFMPASEEAQRDFMKSTRATYDTLKQSPSMFANIEASKKLIPAASVFMGTGGEGMKAAASFLNNRLGMNVNTEGVKTAEELRSRLFQGILANLKRLDSQPSERQQAALEQALGSLNTDPNALSNVLDSYADTVRNNIDTHNAEVQSAISRGVKFPYDPIIKVPAKANAPEVWVRDASGKLVKQ